MTSPTPTPPARHRSAPHALAPECWRDILQAATQEPMPEGIALEQVIDQQRGRARSLGEAR